MVMNLGQSVKEKDEMEKSWGEMLVTNELRG